MKKGLFAMSAVLVLWLSACSTAPIPADEMMTDRTYRTGTNIPDRDRVTGLSPEEFERRKAEQAGTLIKDPMKSR